MTEKDLKQFIQNFEIIKLIKSQTIKDIADDIGVGRQHLANALTSLKTVIPLIQSEYINKNKRLLKK